MSDNKGEKDDGANRVTITFDGQVISGMAREVNTSADLELFYDLEEKWRDSLDVENTVVIFLPVFEAVDIEIDVDEDGLLTGYAPSLAEYQATLEAGGQYKFFTFQAGMGADGDIEHAVIVARDAKEAFMLFLDKAIFNHTELNHIGTLRFEESGIAYRPESRVVVVSYHRWGG